MGGPGMAGSQNMLGSRMAGPGFGMPAPSPNPQRPGFGMPAPSSNPQPHFPAGSAHQPTRLFAQFQNQGMREQEHQAQSNEDSANPPQASMDSQNR